MALWMTVLAQAGGGTPPASEDGGGLVLWAVLLLALAVVLFFIEVFLPSGGVLGALSVTALLAGVVMLFQVGTAWGLIGATVAVLSLPFALGFAIRIWPHTPIGRALMLNQAEDGEFASQRTPQAPPTGPGAGTLGQAATDLRPVGTCVINGRREHCLAVGGIIPRSTEVEVVGADSTYIKVRPAR